MIRRPIVSRDDAGAVLPAALPALTELRARGLTHRWVRHVRSSQAFALSLFAPLSEDGSRRVLAHLGLSVIEAKPAVFEFEDEEDRLGEASPRSQHRTQVDVVLRGTTADGERVAALIEVKLSELDFGSCSAFQSADNPTRVNCRSAGFFGDDRESCFQLQNHGRGRRRYDVYLPEPATPEDTSDDGGCLVRGGRNQPMRNLALAHLLVAEGELDRAVYALCAPTAHPTIWRRYQEFQAVFPGNDQVWTAQLPAEVVMRHQNDGGAAFVERYGPALTNQALLHMTPDGCDLLGIWVQRGQQLESYYPDDEFAGFAEKRLAGQDWSVALEYFPESSPYMVWWETARCSFSESAEDVYQRLSV